MKAKPKGARYRNLVVRGGVILASGLVACAHKVEPKDRWAQPGGTEGRRAADYVDCVSRATPFFGWSFSDGLLPPPAPPIKTDETVYRDCMTNRGWHLSDEPGSADRDAAPKDEKKETQ